MGEIEVIGLVVVGASAILGLFMMFIQLLIKPMNDLTVIVTKLMTLQDSMVTANTRTEAKVEALDLRLDVVERDIARSQGHVA